MITVHHLNKSRSQRVLWLLEELRLDYNVVRYDRDEKTMLAPAALRKVHPLGKSAVLVDDGQVVAESGAIIEYLVERYDSAHVLEPSPGTPGHLRWWRSTKRPSRPSSRACGAMAGTRSALRTQPAWRRFRNCWSVACCARASAWWRSTPARPPSTCLGSVT